MSGDRAASVPQGGGGIHIPFVDLLGFELVQYGEGASTIVYCPKPQHMNSFGVTHGGVLMTLLDVAMALAARNRPQATGVLTIEMKTSFMRLCASRQLRAQGVLKHATATMAFAEATVYDLADQACAHATGTFKYVTRVPRRDSPTAPQGEATCAAR